MTGQTVRRRRERLGLTQARLAEVAGVTPQTVMRLEQGRSVHATTLARIKMALEVAALRRKRLIALQVEQGLTPAVDLAIKAPESADVL